MRKVKIGVIGLGNMGSEHCRLLLSGKAPEAELSCVADLRAERREWAKNSLPEGTAIYKDGLSLCCRHESVLHYEVLQKQPIHSLWQLLRLHM